MKPGRKPKPTVLRRLNGNAGKRALNTNEPTPTPLIDAEPPRYLGKAARGEWQRLAPQLVAVGLLSEADLALFAAYCSAFGDLIEAEKRLKRGGHVSSTGKRSPWFYVKARAIDTMVKVGDRFGLSPSARASLGRAMAPPDRQASGELAEYLSQKPDNLP